jgi:hypothetical protein
MSLCRPKGHIVDVEVYLLSFLTSTLDRGEWRVSRFGRFNLDKEERKRRGTLQRF